MSDKERQQDDVEQKEDGKEESDTEEGSGSSGIHKYFGKSTKAVKLLNMKIKKQIKYPNDRNLAVWTQTNAKDTKQLKTAHEKTKLKCEYKWNSEILKSKPKLKLTLTPYLALSAFEEASMSWKNVISKVEDENFDFKVSGKKCLNIKYKRTRFFNDKKLRHRLQVETSIFSYNNFKASFSLESMSKQLLFENHQYLNSSQIKGKLSLKDFDYPSRSTTYRFDFSEKLTFLINSYKAKQETKVNMSFGQKQSSEFKSNIQVTSDDNLWTAYAGVIGYQWGLNFDQAKILFNLRDNWKVGCMYGQKNSWELVLTNPKFNKSFCNSFSLNVGNKNVSLNLKNKFAQNYIGKVNYELAFQNPLKNLQFNKMNFGLTLNVNL